MKHAFTLLAVLAGLSSPVAVSGAELSFGPLNPGRFAPGFFSPAAVPAERPPLVYEFTIKQPRPTAGMDLELAVSKKEQPLRLRLDTRLSK